MRKLVSRRLPANSWVLLCGVAVVGSFRPAAADTPGLVWSPARIVDQPVVEMSSTSGPSMVFAGDRWHIVYTLPGGVAVCRTQQGVGWGPFVSIADDTAAAHDPKIAAEPHSMRAVWDDARTGHREVWTRRSDGETWLAQECISCDDGPSRSPVIAATRIPPEDCYFVAWEEESLSIRQVRGRFCCDDVWGPVQTVSQSPAEAFEPALTAIMDDGVAVAWTDTRSGVPQIYLRTWNHITGWQPERRVSNEPNPCRRPSVASSRCCGDLRLPHWQVAYEVELPGAPECRFTDVSGISGWLSPVDGVPSIRPHLAAFAFMSMVGPVPNYLAVWTDAPVLGPRRHVFEDFRYGETEALSSSGLSHALLATTDGLPRAPILVMWLEEGNSWPSLIAKSGSQLGGLVNVQDGVRSQRDLVALPNPCREHVTLRLGGATASAVRFVILDATGRRVRSFQVGQAASGTNAVWDLRDDHGRRVRPGHYFAVVEQARRRLWRTMVVLE